MVALLDHVTRRVGKRSLMDGRTTLLVFLAPAVAAVTLAAVAYGALVQTFEVTPRPSKASKKHRPRSISLGIELSVRDDTGAKPSPLQRTVMRFNKGGQYNARYLPKCKAQALRSKGPSACPKRSRIGSGTATADARPVLANVKAKLTIFNGSRRKGADRVILYAVPEISSPITLVGEVKKKPKGRYDYVLTFDVPPIPTLPGQPNASVTSVRTKTLRRIVKRKRVRIRRRGRVSRRTARVPLIAAPRSCKRKRWYAEGVFAYESGETITKVISTRCRR
jgi:hypothetical protein